MNKTGIYAELSAIERAIAVTVDRVIEQRENVVTISAADYKTLTATAEKYRYLTAAVRTMESECAKTEKYSFSVPDIVSEFFGFNPFKERTPEIVKGEVSE